MNEDKDPIHKRVFISQPRKQQQYARHTVRPVPNGNISTDSNLMRPLDNLGWNNQPFEIYHHSSTVDALKKLLHETMSHAPHKDGCDKFEAKGLCNCGKDELLDKVKKQVPEIINIALNNQKETTI